MHPTNKWSKTFGHEPLTRLFSTPTRPNSIRLLAAQLSPTMSLWSVIHLRNRFQSVLPNYTQWGCYTGVKSSCSSYNKMRSNVAEEVAATQTNNGLQWHRGLYITFKSERLHSQHQIPVRSYTTHPYGHLLNGIEAHQYDFCGVILIIHHILAEYPSYTLKNQ